MEKLASLVRVSDPLLVHIPPVDRDQLSPRVVRILGQNPGKFTLQGTNTYLVGERPPYTLVDAGEGRPGYVPLLESALQHGLSSQSPPRQHVSDIVISHWHHDHVGGLFSVLTLLRSLWDALDSPLPFLPPRVHKFPLTTPLDPRVLHAVQPIQPDMYAPSPDGSLFHDLHDAQTFPISVSVSADAPDPDAVFRVVHAPGHTQDSIALVFPSERVLYTADSVLGRGTAVFEDLATYLSTLRTLLSHTDEDTTLWPAHGPVVHNGAEVIKGYIDHRMEREAQILQLLQQSPQDTWSTRQIVSTMYAAYPRELWDAAAGSINQHLQKLVLETKVVELGGEGNDAQWKLHNKL